MTHSATQELQFRLICNSIPLKLNSGVISSQDSSPLLPHVKLRTHFVAQTGVVKIGNKTICRKIINELIPAEKNVT
jgi:hypothetical protein